MAGCSVSGCRNRTKAKGLCSRHYMMTWHRGATDALYGRSDRDRLYNRLATQPEGKCWIASGHRGGIGYVNIRCADGETRGAHRLSYIVHKGEIPVGMVVMHTCDQPACVNPAHLEAGSYADNMHDMDAKGRRKIGFKSGEAHSAAKLTIEAVRFIKAHPEMPLTELGTRFGVGPNTVRAVRIGKTWKDT